jgi:putative PIG3 family NAD(P)H quinone oxidoreductase
VRSIAIEGKGREARLVIAEVPRPTLAPGEVEIRVRATAVNQADLMQRRGLYPPPPGASEILGLECAGVISAVGEGAERFAVGDRVMALLPGGGYAEYACVDAGSVMQIPNGMDFDVAGALPEVYLTVYRNLFQIVSVPAGGYVLVHGGGSGVGTAAIQMIRESDAHIAVTCGSPEKLARCEALGADLAVSYREPFADAVLAWAKGGLHAVLDPIGAPYVEQHLRCLRTGGALVLIGLRGGTRAELDLAALLRKRLRVIGSTLRALPAEEKATIATGFIETFGGALRAGRVRPVVDRVLPLEQAQAAHEVVEASAHFGKVVLRV